MTAHDSIEDDQDSQPEQVSAVSKLLIEAREAKGLSQKEVAEQLYLTVTFIRYIDEGAFDKIPKPAFIKGYLRSYARVVGLDGDAVIEAYNQEQN
ncbi:MAG: helix-turn-helix domain-containing protein, partial [Pseudomonadales bacterium]